MFLEKGGNMNDKLWSVVSYAITLVIVGFIVLFAFVVGSGGGSSSDYNSDKGYNDSIPEGMTQYESNYIGNRLSEEGYSEQEAKEMRELIHTFNQLQD